jgi:signal transduction histidine kinase
MTTISPTGYALIGITAIVGALVAVLTFALLRFLQAAKNTRDMSRSSGAETALLSAALQDAVAKLKAQERATAARAEASERLSEEIISSLTAGLLVVGLNGELRIVNPACRRLLELPDAPGATRDAVPSRVQPLMDVIDECLKGGGAIARRSVNLADTGRGAQYLGVTVSPLFEHDGRLNGAICLFTDLTAVRELEEKLRLKESLATVGELTAGIAHEFRNGLATIHGYSKLFNLGELPELYREYITGIRAETESLSQIVTNFLNFARPAELTLARVDLRAVCARAADEIRAEARALGGDVLLTGHFGAVEGDEVLLRQAFSNLLRNALEACASAELAPVIAIDSEVDRQQGVSRITVNDSGPGIPTSSRERVFRPFFTSKRNGTGLGLALVQKIIVFHNGGVVAGESPQGGASLQVTLPLISTSSPARV